MEDRVRVHVFDTEIGRCGLGWTEHGVRAVSLPHGSDEQVRRDVLKRTGLPEEPAANPPATIAGFVRRIRNHLAGAPDKLTDVALDSRAQTEFQQAVYGKLRRVAPGQVTSYGDLAERIGKPGAARAIGRAMATNPTPIVVPCHRVLANDGLGSFSAPGENGTKLRLLTIEGYDLSQLYPIGVSHVRRVDGKLAKVIDRVGAYRATSGRSSDPFTALARAIVHQQVSMKAGATIFSRLVQACGHGNKLAPKRILATDVGGLRQVGLSRQKSSYVLDLAARVLNGSLDLSNLKLHDDQRVIEELTAAVKGIGVWSAQMHLIFHLGRLDVLPVDDLGIQRGAQMLYRLRERPNAKKLTELAEPWRPFRSIGSWYLWRSLEGRPLAAALAAALAARLCRAQFNQLGPG